MSPAFGSRGRNARTSPPQKSWLSSLSAASKPASRAISRTCGFASAPSGKSVRARISGRTR